jgi:hypothetical protein
MSKSDLFLHWCSYAVPEDQPKQLLRSSPVEEENLNAVRELCPPSIYFIPHTYLHA